MKNLIFTTTLLFCTTFFIKAQSVLFSEDFESSPVTSVLNTWNSETQLTEGPSPCSLASRGDTSDFNSSSIDFKGAQNDSYFLCANPEDPCGGFYNATLATATQDFSGMADSIVFTARYYIGISLGWGAPQLEVIFDNGVTSDTIRDEFYPNGNWLDISYKLPSSMNAASIDITINMGGGEGVALDDIEIIKYLDVSGYAEENNIEFSVYPNPANNWINIQTKSLNATWTIYNISAEKMKSGKANKSTKIDVADLSPGVYFLEVANNQSKRTEKLIIQ